MELKFFSVNKIINFFLSLVCCLDLGAQKGFDYSWPIDSPFVITGNYGELRPNHFHAGIDFSTNGKVDLPIYAAEDGFVSRIRISAFGYGKCVYLTHNDGKVTVYAHLNSFSLKLDKIAKKQQHDQKSFEIDHYPKHHFTYVKKGEIIGLSGNSGGSTGPHLHFEIRDEKTEVPLNPLKHYGIRDRVAPELSSFAFYDLSDTSDAKFLMNCRFKKNTKDTLLFENDKLVLDRSILGVAFSGFDKVYFKGNANNIYSAQVFLDDKLIYAHELNHIAFSDGRYVNEFTEVQGRIKYQKCFLPTLYPAGIFPTVVNKGRIVLNDTLFHKLKLVICDESGNTKSVQLQVRARKRSSYKKPAIKGDVEVLCHKDVSATSNGLFLKIPAGTFYQSSTISVKNEIAGKNGFSILPENKNLNAAITIGFVTPEKYKAFKKKVVLKEGSTVITPTFRHDSLFYAIKKLGRYTLALDTSAPKLKALITPGALKDTWKLDSFSFSMSDNLSGIGSYDLYLNNIWVVGEYDAKSDKITYYFDEDTPIGLLQFRLEVQDKVGNREVLYYLLKK